MKQLDHIDREILSILQTDCRITAKDIATRLGMSKTPVYERIKKLEIQGYIVKYVAITDPKKAGKGLIIYLSVLLDNHNKESVDEFVEKINMLPEVNECYYVSGNIDFLLKVFIRDMDDYHRFITSDFSNIPNMSRFYSSFVMETSKYETAFEFELDV
ncbi:MAG: Lrp/AsnC family transcriptional regulator [Salinivirgaceae bacterium]|nr:Lrp/AsnC family transcriptional regulator [Salinivirgaceae bacterium]